MSRLQSAAGSTATSIPDVIKDIPGQINDIPDLINGVPELIEELFPKNCSLGTGQFCVGLSNNISCSDLPLNMTDIIPQDIMKHFGESFDDIRSLNIALARVTAPYLRDMLIIGMVSMFVGVLFFIASLYGWLPCLKKWVVRPGIQCAVVRLVFGLVLSVPFMIPTIILQILRSKLEHVPSWIEVQQGNAYGLCLGCLCCSFLVVIVEVLAPLLGS